MCTFLQIMINNHLFNHDQQHNKREHICYNNSCYLGYHFKYQVNVLTFHRTKQSSNVKCLRTEVHGWVGEAKELMKDQMTKERSQREEIKGRRNTGNVSGNVKLKLAAEAILSNISRKKCRSKISLVK